MRFKGVIITMLLFLATISILSATTQKVAIIDFEPEERGARTIAGQMMNARRGDFVSAFGEYAQYELIDLNQSKRAMESEGISSVRNLTAQIAGDIGKKLEVDIVIWGTISDLSSTEIRILANVMSVRTQSINQLRFNLPKRSADRRRGLNSELLDKIAGIAGGELVRLFSIGEQQLSAQNYTAAYSSFSRISEIEPNNLEAYFYLGYIKFLQNDFAGSARYYERGLQINPADERILNNIAESLRRDNRHEEAVSYLLRLAETSPEEIIWFRIADLYIDLNYIYEAIEALNNSLEINPESERSHYRLGVILFDNGYIPESIEHLEYIAERHPEDDLINRKLTAAYMRTGQLEQAIRNYQNQIERNPNNTTAYLNLAGAYRTLERNSEALSTLNRLQAIDQNNSTVYIRLSDVQLSLNNLTEAERNANRAMSINADLYEPYLLLSQIFQLRGYNRYESFLDLDEKARNAFGREADQLISQRDQARSEANELFTRARNHLNSGQTKTKEPSILRDIAARRQLLDQLIEETRRTFFD